MPHDRFYTNQPLLPSDTVEIYEDEFNHLTRVLRVREHEVIEVINGKGRLAKLEVIQIEKKKAILVVRESHYFEKPKFRLVLAQALPKVNHLDFIVEKGCELGMTDLWLFEGERSEKSDLSTNQQTRIQHLLIAALKQCGGLWLPQVKLCKELKKWQKDELNEFKSFYGSLEKDVKPLWKAWNQTKSEAALFFVGPEKGFSDQEHSLLKELGAEGVSLHPNILRTETAALCALSIISHFHYQE